MLRVPKKQKKYVAQTRSIFQEKEVADKIGGFVAPGSGSGKVKGDVIVSGIARLELKTTEKQSFRVTKKMLDKIEKASIPFDEVPAMIIEFVDSRGNKEKAYCVIAESMLYELIERANHE